MSEGPPRPPQGPPPPQWRPPQGPPPPGQRQPSQTPLPRAELPWFRRHEKLVTALVVCGVVGLITLATLAGGSDTSGSGASDDKSATADDTSAASDKSEPRSQRSDDCDLPAPKWSPISAPTTMAEGKRLVERLDAIAPGLASVPCQTIDNARNSCTSILGGSQRLAWATRTRFVGDGIE